MPADCIWMCGREATTDEDVLPNWAREHLGGKTGLKRWDIRGLTPPGEKPPPFNPRSETRLGIWVKARKSVCRDCNNGWMSELQNAAKPLLLPMIRGAQVSIGPASQEVIARWGTMTAIALEYAAKQTVEPFRRQFLYEKQAVPPNTGILFGYMPEPEMDNMVATGLWRFHEQDKGYVELFTIRCLPMLFVQGLLPPIVHDVFAGALSKMVQIWPQKSLAGLRWPSASMSSREVENIWIELLPAKLAR